MTSCILVGHSYTSSGALVVYLSGYPRNIGFSTNTNSINHGHVFQDFSLRLHYLFLEYSDTFYTNTRTAVLGNGHWILDGC